MDVICAFSERQRKKKPDSSLHEYSIAATTGTRQTYKHTHLSVIQLKIVFIHAVKVGGRNICLYIVYMSRPYVCIYTSIHKYLRLSRISSNSKVRSYLYVYIYIHTCMYFNCFLIKTFEYSVTCRYFAELYILCSNKIWCMSNLAAHHLIISSIVIYYFEKMQYKSVYLPSQLCQKETQLLWCSCQATMGVRRTKRSMVLQTKRPVPIYWIKQFCGLTQKPTFQNYDNQKSLSVFLANMAKSLLDGEKRAWSAMPLFEDWA